MTLNHTSVSWPEEGYRGCNMCARTCTGQRQMNSGGKEERIEMVVITLTFIHIPQKWIPSLVTTHTLSHSCASRYTNPHFTATTQKHTFKEGWDVATQTYSHTHTQKIAEHSCKDGAISVSVGSLFVSNGEGSQVTQERKPSGRQFFPHFSHSLHLLPVK